MFPAHLEKGSYEADLVVGPLELFHRKTQKPREKFWEDPDRRVLDVAQTYDIDDYREPNVKNRKRNNCLVAVAEGLMVFFMLAYFLISLFYNGHWRLLVDLHNQATVSGIHHKNAAEYGKRFAVLVHALNAYAVLPIVMGGLGLLAPVVSSWSLSNESDEYKCRNALLHTVIVAVAILSAVSVGFLHFMWVLFDVEKWCQDIYRYNCKDKDGFNATKILCFFLVNYVLCALVGLCAAIVVAHQCALTRKVKEEMLLELLYTASRQTSAYNVYRTNRRRCELSKAEKVEYVKPYVYLKQQERVQQESVKEEASTV